MGKTLVTGAAGFIGSHLVKRLLDERREVIAVDNFHRGNVQNYKDLGIKIICYNIDLTDSNQVFELFDNYNITTVFHLAARIGSIEYLHGNVDNELVTLQTNLLIDSNVFKACRKHKINKIIYTSSISVYPIDLQKDVGSLFAEKDLKYVNPEGGYGWAKYIGELQLCWLKDINIGIARIFNVFGELKSIGKSSHVISRLIKNTIINDKEVVIWGSGEQTRCFLYISDCIDALLLLEAKATLPPLILNIGSDEPITINDLANLIISISGKDIEVKYDLSKPVGPMSRTPIIDKAKEILNWEPKVSFEDGILETFKWVTKRMEMDKNELYNPES